MVTVLPVHMAKKIDPDCPVINVTSHSDNQGKWLSPFYLGPVKLYDGKKSLNMENAWQYSKVYPEFFDKENDIILPEYFSWAETGWNTKSAHRYPMGKGRKPLFTYWDKERLDYITARQRVYAILYAQVAMKNQAYDWLIRLYHEHKSLVLLDFDAYDHRSMDYDWNDVVLDPDRKMGHGFVLAMMLEGFDWLNAKRTKTASINIFSGCSEGVGLSNCTVLAKQKGTCEKDFPVWFKGREFADAEAAFMYHTKKIDNLNGKAEVCVQIIAAKLLQYPELVNYVDEKGGTQWLNTCTHYTHAISDSFKAWEGKGKDSLFLSCLIKAYESIKDGSAKPEPRQQELF